MLAIKKKTILIIIAITVVVMVAVVGGVQLLMKSGDPNVQAYKDALSESVQGDCYHYAITEKVSNAEGGWDEYEYTRHYYRCDSDMMRLDDYEDRKSYSLNYGGKNYHANISSLERNVGIYENAQPWMIEDWTYYSVDDRYVTYEETDEQFIVTFENQQMLGISPRMKEEDKDGYTSALSIAYFDKEWNLQKFVIRETWISITEDGKEYERVREKVSTHYDVTKEEVKEYLTKEKEYLESLLGN